ncbi:MAG: hypothetical protein J3R72DRAFT_431740 [Linnemannia gamsii]|nr:MAG: hypothetical protein J3R72DRAFT_431740 [Linnemannia gamsii]
MDQELSVQGALQHHHQPISSLSIKRSQSMIAAFDNSLVADNIFQHLSPKDTSNCLEVCKALNTIGQPYLWKTIAHHYTYHSDSCDPVAHPPVQRWEPIKDDHSNIDDKQSKRDTPRKSAHINPHSVHIFSTQKDLIVSNAFRVRSLKIDYSARNLLDIPFIYLTRLSLNCRYSHIADPLIKAEGRRRAEILLQDQVVDSISLCPRLRVLEVSYKDCWQPQGRLPFSVRLVQAVQHHQPTSATTNNTNTSYLHSLTLKVQGSQSFADICSIVETCPLSLKELTVQSSYFHNPLYRPMLERSQNLRKRLESMKNSSKDNSTTNATNNIYTSQQRVPALRLLSVSWFSARDGQELSVVDSELFFIPLLGCFPELQTLSVPKIPCTILNGGYTLVSQLITNYPDLTTIDFGGNLITEYSMLLLLSKPLQGLSMRITPADLDRVLPTLLHRSGPTLKLLRLCEMGFKQGRNRSPYIADILTSCPRLETFVVMASSGKVKLASKISLQELLHTEWACSGLEKLSISIDEIITAPTRESDTGCNGIVAAVLGEDEEEQDNRSNLSTRTELQRAQYAEKVYLVSEFCKRLQSLPDLMALDLQWGPDSYMVPYDCGMAFSDKLLTMDVLKWMGLI